MAPSQGGNESIHGTVGELYSVKQWAMGLTRQEGARSGGPGRPMEDVFIPGYGKPSSIDVTCHMFVKAHFWNTFFQKNILKLLLGVCGELDTSGQGWVEAQRGIGKKKDDLAQAAAGTYVVATYAATSALRPGGREPISRGPPSTTLNQGGLSVSCFPQAASMTDIITQEDSLITDMRKSLPSMACQGHSGSRMLWLNFSRHLVQEAPSDTSKSSLDLLLRWSLPSGTCLPLRVAGIIAGDRGDSGSHSHSWPGKRYLGAALPDTLICKSTGCIIGREKTKWKVGFEAFASILGTIWNHQ